MTLSKILKEEQVLHKITRFSFTKKGCTEQNRKKMLFAVRGRYYKCVIIGMTAGLLYILFAEVVILYKTSLKERCRTGGEDQGTDWLHKAGECFLLFSTFGLNFKKVL